MYNHKLLIEYDGRNFKGWQKQKYTKETVQEYIESSLEKLLKEKIILTVAGRTDSGVSAYNQVANFHYRNRIETAGIKYSLNSILPGDITIKNISLVSPDFHSRYSAVKREYIYKISFCKRSIGRNEFYRINYSLDYEKIDEFIKFVKELTSFRSFCKNKEDKNNFSCLIYDLRYKYKKVKNELIFTITANRFLHSMVRSIIGCALEIGRGKLNLNYIQEKIKKGEKPGSVYLPSNALFLNKIYY